MAHGKSKALVIPRPCAAPAPLLLMLLALVAACGISGCGSADSAAGSARSGPGLEPPGTGPTAGTPVPGNEFGNQPPATAGPGLEPPGVPAGAAGAAGDDVGVGADAGAPVEVDRGTPLPPPGIDPAERGAVAGPATQDDDGASLQRPPPDGGIPAGWEDVFGGADPAPDAGVP